MDPDGLHRTWTDLRLGLGMPLGERLSIGAAGRYLRVDQNISTGPFGPSLASDGTQNGAITNTLGLDLGATATLGDSFRIGVTGHNLTSGGNALAPTTFAGGLGFFTKDVAIEADGLADFTTFAKTQGRLMVGLEVFLADHYALRGGYRYDNGTQTHAASLGVGYIDRKWSIEIAGRRDVVGDHPATVGALSLRYFYDATGPSQADAPDSF
jgi:hypothetical protein